MCLNSALQKLPPSPCILNVHIAPSTTLAAPPAGRRIVCFRQAGSSAKGGRPSGDVEFRHDLGHLQQIQQLEKQLFAKSDGWRGGLFEEQLRKRNTYLLYVLLEEGEACASQETTASHSQTGRQSGGSVLGYIVVQVNSVTAHVNKLAVAPEARRSGLAAALLRAVLQLAVRERRVLCATLHVDVSNTPALGLYRKAGFVEDGTIEHYYGQGRHAHKLIVDLQESAAMRAFLEGLCDDGCCQAG